MAYNLQSVNAPLAVEEFAIEMRAMSTAQAGHRRRRRLPLRLLREVASTNTPPPVEEQLDPRRVAPGARSRVTEVLERFQEAHSAFRRGQLPSIGFLEAQHSLIIDLGLALGRAKKSDNFPTLVGKLIDDEALEKRLKQLGSWRNDVKHRGRYGLADEVIGKGLSAAWTAASHLTGADVDPVSVQLRELARDPETVFSLPPMFTRSGRPRQPHR